MTEFEQWVERARRKHGDKLDLSELPARFRPHLRSGVRIKVRTTYGSGETYERTGTVGITTGWRPAFLLMHRSNADGSSDVLSERDEIIAVHNGRSYEPCG